MSRAVWSPAPLPTPTAHFLSKCGLARTDILFMRFDPRCPTDLQTAVYHAERFAELLTCLAVTTHVPKHAPTYAWLFEHSREVQTFVLDVMQQWTTGCASPDAATFAVNVYLRTLHRATLDILHLVPPLDCCPEDSATPALVDPLAITRPALERDGSNDTLFDPHALIDDVSEPSPSSASAESRPSAQSAQLDKKT